MATDAMSSLTDFDGERRYHDTNAAYALPNDTPEHDRLEQQGQKFLNLMNGLVIHAPLTASTTHKALDMGCGTGVVTDSIAAQFPDAKVYGLDLSPVSNIRPRLPNIEYAQANFNDVTASNSPDPRFEKGSFDYIFSRLLIAGMTNWKGYVERCVQLAKPGGWIEMQELDFTHFRAPNPLDPSQRSELSPQAMTLSEFKNKPHPTAIWQESGNWFQTMQNLHVAQGMDATCGLQLPHIFADAGLKDVSVKRYMLAVSPWEGLTEREKDFGAFLMNTMGKHLPVFFRKLAQGQDVVAKEEVDEACEESDVAKWCEARAFFFFYVICGRKPES